MKEMKSAELRELFFNYFEKRGHRRVSSSPVFPQDDPTLLFTNAGMNQFKNIFLGLEKRDYKRAVSSQKCIRVSGKHNDLEEVGRDTYHHTFFEMLGNWSFGDYYKKEAIEFAWEFLTSHLGLPKERLWATVYETDDEAYDLWGEVTDIGDGRVLRFGKEENFWEMGDIGPCGPDSEIHMDLGPGIGCGRPDCGPNCLFCKDKGESRYEELWNLVFIQYNRDEGGELHELPSKHVDTGMGLERITAVVNGKRSNYDTDLFLPIISEIEEISGKSYGDPECGIPFRVIADHIRTLSFAIADGVMPSNEGRGYVIRRILRRAARFGRMLDVHDPFIYKLVPRLSDMMGNAYTELLDRCEHISLVIRSEEEGFGRTLDRGIELFESAAEEALKSGTNVIPGSEAFRLYDTYGFPIDLTQLMASEKNLSVDMDGFNTEMERQRKRGREASKFVGMTSEEGEWAILSDGKGDRFVGYDTFSSESTLVRYRNLGDGGVEVILDRTPFYGESGGQVGDVGRIYSGDFTIQVEDTVWVGSEIVHRGKLTEGKLPDRPAKVAAEVDRELRMAAARNHTSTHLLQGALRKVVGTHVHQAGSLVAPDRLRFDFTHFASLSQTEIEQVEEIVNRGIIEDMKVDAIEESFDEAKKMGAIALFGEKYDEVVRVVKIDDFSLELCGGTHVHSTGEIGSFTIVSEGAVASGVRRIESVTGMAAFELMKGRRKLLEEASRLLNVSQGDLESRIERLLEENRTLRKRLEDARSGSTGEFVDSIARRGVNVDGVRVVAAKVDVPDIGAFRKMADSLRDSLSSGVGVLGAILGDKASLLVVVTDDLIKEKGIRAGDLVKKIAAIVGGGGGGKAHLAQAGGKDKDRLDEALAAVENIVRERLRTDKI